MKKLIQASIIENTELANGIYSLWINAPEIASLCTAGQFIQLYIEQGQHLLPRPISVCDADDSRIRIVFAVAGAGTAWLSALIPGSTVRLMGALGNGFVLSENKNVALVGGGIGVPPLLLLAKKLCGSNNVEVFNGFREASILTEDFKKLGVKTHIATDGGSEGFHGNAAELLASSSFKPDIIYSCGPKIMLKSLAGYASSRKIKCYVSMEERMACGIGACVGCVVKIRGEGGEAYKKVCSDGPVFDAEEVVFE